jgi:hypothetical protein
VQVFDVEKVILAGNHDSFIGKSGYDTISTGLVLGDDSVNLNTTTSTNDVQIPCTDKVLYSFIRRRSQGKSHSYGLTTVKELENGEIVEVSICL